MAIIAPLIAILLPSLCKARYQAKNTLCKSNLHQIGAGCATYSGESKKGAYPSWETIGGGANFRVLPGRVTSDPGSLPEIYGLPAVFARSWIITASADYWTCPLNTVDAQ